MWKHPELHKIIALYNGTEQFVDFCQYGTPWKKGTTFLTFGVKDMNLKRCIGQRGVCSRTAEEHQVLKGKLSDNKTFWTDIAEPYPEKLCGVIAKCLRPDVPGSDERIEKNLSRRARRRIRDGVDYQKRPLMPMKRKTVNRVAICLQVAMNNVSLTIGASDKKLEHG